MLSWFFENDACPDICLAGQFVFKFIEERYDNLRVPQNFGTPFLQIFTIHILLFYKVWYFLTLSLNSTPQSIIFCGFKQNMYHSTPQAHHVDAPQCAGDGRHAPRTDGRYDMHARCGKGKKFTMWRCGCLNVHLYTCTLLPISDSEGIKILIIYILLIKKTEPLSKVV